MVHPRGPKLSKVRAMDGRSAVKRVQASPELLSGVQVIRSELEHLKKRLEEKKKIISFSEVNL